MIQYKLQKNQYGQDCAVTIIGQNISIPFAEGNSDYAEYLKWLDEGNTPLAADAPEQPQ